MSDFDIKGTKIKIGDYICYPLQPARNKRGHISIFLVYGIESSFLNITCVAHLGTPDYKYGNKSLHLNYTGPMTGNPLVLPRQLINPKIELQNLKAFLRLEGMEITDDGFESIYERHEGY